MLKSLSARIFLNIVIGIAVFCIMQITVLLLFEWGEVLSGEPLGTELSEMAILVCISVGVLAIVSSVFWFINKRLLRPLEVINKAAIRIANGFLDERIESNFSQDEIKTMAVALNTALDNYSNVCSKLKRFSGNASHQLRNPIAAMRTICDVSLRKEHTAKEYREVICGLHDEILLLGQVLEQLLMLAKVAPNELRQSFVPVDLSPITREVSSRIIEASGEKNLCMSEDYLNNCMVLGDRVMLQQVITNIMNNAVQYSSQGGRISLKVFKETPDAIIEIADEGPGIPEYIRLSVEKPDQMSNDTGKGLGLLIASEITELHNGRLEIISGVSHGAIVRIRIPALNV